MKVTAANICGQLMVGVRERIRKAVIRVAATQDKDLSALPVFELTLAPVLALASNIYKCGVLVRRLLYQFHILHQSRLPVPVISVGNITWGGTGKTPMVEFLARHFLAARVCPLILSRGYRGGDEVRLLQRHLQGLPAKFGVGPDRAKVALSVLQQQVAGRHNIPPTILSLESQENFCRKSDNVGIAILDDGMQHWALARDIEIVMVNVISLWGSGRLVPRGPLRESLPALLRAHVVVLHHAKLVPSDKLKSVRRALDSTLKKGSIVVASHMRALCFYKLLSKRESNSPSEIPLQAVKDAVVLCVSAIGCPESLSLVLLQEGASHVERLDFSDHSKFELKDLEQIKLCYEQLQSRYPLDRVLLVVSEKDYMRDCATIAELASNGVDVLVLHSQLEIISGYGNELAFTKLLTSVCIQKFENS